MTNVYKDGVRDHPSLDPADLTWDQLREFVRILKLQTGADKGYWQHHPLHKYVEMEETHFDECVAYGCGCDPIFQLVDGKIVY